VEEKLFDRKFQRARFMRASSCVEALELAGLTKKVAKDANNLLWSQLGNRRGHKFNRVEKLMVDRDLGIIRICEMQQMR
jgi:hypothetical protein